MRVLILGDSHTHGFYGQALERLFKAMGHDVTRVGWVSANANHYLTGKYKTLKLGHTGDFDTDVKGKSFDLTVMTLGTNDAAAFGSPSSVSTAASNIKKLADSINTKKLYWVGPPAFDDAAARKYNPAFAADDLNTRSARLWDATSSLFGGFAIDPRAATRPFTGTMAPTAKMPKGDIHFQKAGGEAWAKFVFAQTSGAAAGTVSVRSEPTVSARKTAIQQEQRQIVTEKASGGLPVVPLAVAAGVILLFLFSRRSGAAQKA